MSAHDPARRPAPCIQIRPLETHEERRACVELQRRTWGTAFTEVVPPAMQKIAQRLGGIAAGAFDDSGRLLGFVYGVTGLEDGRPVHWSHMLAVDPEARNGGIGRRLKAYQRDTLLRRGVRTVYWTYDPLAARNAHLNLNRLGARVVEYARDMYGDTASRLHQGLGTDRFVVVWHLDRAGVEGTLDASTPPPLADGYRAAPMVNESAGPDDPAEPLLVAEPTVRVAIPADIHAVREHRPETARRWRTTTRRAFLWYLERGYRVAGFVRDADGAGGAYVLTTEPEDV